MTVGEGGRGGGGEGVWVRIGVTVGFVDSPPSRGAGLESRGRGWQRRQLVRWHGDASQGHAAEGASYPRVRKVFDDAGPCQIQRGNRRVDLKYTPPSLAVTISQAAHGQVDTEQALVRREGANECVPLRIRRLQVGWG